MYTDVEVLVQLYTAVIFGLLTPVRNLLDEHSVAQQEILDHADLLLELSLQFGDGAMFFLLSACGVAFSIPRSIWYFPPLMKACEFRCYRVVKWLIKERRKLRIERADIRSVTALGEAKDVMLLEILGSEGLYPPKWGFPFFSHLVS